MPVSFVSSNLWIKHRFSNLSDPKNFIIVHDSCIPKAVIIKYPRIVALLMYVKLVEMLELRLVPNLH